MNTFEFVRCSKNDARVRSMFDKMVFDPSLCHTDALSIAILNISFSRKVRKERKLQFLQTLLWSAYCTFTLSPMLCLLFRAFVTFWMVKWKVKEYFQKSICQNKFLRFFLPIWFVIMCNLAVDFYILTQKLRLRSLINVTN